MKKLLLVLALFAGFLAWQSCEYDWIETEAPVIPDTVSFATDIIPIFDRGCDASVCHGTGGVPPDLTRDNAYDDLFAENQIDINTPENSILYVKMAPGGSMNKYTEPGEPELVLKWIQQGALNN